MIAKFGLFVVYLLCFSYASGDDVRRVEVVLNPNCTIDDCKPEANVTDSINLLYVKSTGQKDIIHQLYSTIYTFTILIFQTNLNVNINVDWLNLLSKNETQMYKSIGFTGPIMESCGYLIQTIYEFDDSDGTADMTQKTKNLSEWRVYKTESLDWSFKQNEIGATNIGSFKGQPVNQNGSFMLNIRHYGKEMRDKELPNYLISPESSSVDFVIDSIESNFTYSKFGMTFLFLSDLDGARLTNQKSLDDEYTPGTFQQRTVEVYDALATDTSKVHNYLQWKPIFYYFNEKSLENSTQTRHYELVVNNRDIPNSIALAFYRSTGQRASALNVSFGLEGDVKDGYFYSPTNYLVWTFSVGLGEPALEAMSTLVTFVIFIGFGLPVLVILVGGAVLAVKKYKKRKQSNYEQL